MKFVSDEQIEKQRKEQEFSLKVEKKKEANQVIEQAKEKEHFSLDDYIKQMRPEKQKAPKPITIKDLQFQLDVQKLVEEEKKEEIETLLSDVEIGEIKQELVGVMALPHSGDKRKIFAQLLKNSSTVNNYVDDNVIYRFFNKANTHLKFGVVYSLKYFKTNIVYDELVKQQIRLKEEAQQQNPIVEPVAQTNEQDS